MQHTDKNNILTTLSWQLDYPHWAQKSLRCCIYFFSSPLLIDHTCDTVIHLEDFLALFPSILALVFVCLTNDMLFLNFLIKKFNTKSSVRAQLKALFLINVFFSLHHKNPCCKMDPRLTDFCIFPSSMDTNFIVFSLQPPIYTKQKLYHLWDPFSSFSLKWIEQWFQQ